MTQQPLIPKDPEVIEFSPGNVKEATKGLKSADLWQVPYDDLYVDPEFNVREQSDDLEAHIQNLEKLIEENGYDRDQPMAGYVAQIDGRSRIVITNGHNRYAAIGRLRARGVEIDFVPVVTKTRGTSMEDLTVALATSNSGRPLTPYELGSVVKRLVGYGWDEPKVAQRLNITGHYVADLLFLHSCPKKIRDLVRSGKVAAGTAITAVKKHGDQAYTVLMDAVAKALGQGKTKVTPKHLAPEFKKEVKKASPRLFEAVMSVKEDPGWDGLSPTTREYIEQLISGLPPEPTK